MAISKVVRARVIMDLVKDGVVGNETPYGDGSVDLAAAPVAIKYAQAFYDAYGPQLFEVDGVTPRDPTNAELARNYLKVLRKFHRDILRASRVGSAGDTARSVEAVIVETEADADLGTEA